MRTLPQGGCKVLVLVVSLHKWVYLSYKTVSHHAILLDPGPPICDIPMDARNHQFTPHLILVAKRDSSLYWLVSEASWQKIYHLEVDVFNLCFVARDYSLYIVRERNKLPVFVFGRSHNERIVPRIIVHRRLGQVVAHGPYRHLITLPVDSSHVISVHIELLIYYSLDA